jgi:hypothetical protein
MLVASLLFADSPTWVRAVAAVALAAISFTLVMVPLYLLPKLAQRILQRFFPDPAMEARLKRLGATTRQRQLTLHRRLMRKMQRFNLIVVVPMIFIVGMGGGVLLAWPLHRVGHVIDAWLHPAKVALRWPVFPYVLPGLVIGFGLMVYASQMVFARLLTPREVLASRLCNYAKLRVREEVAAHALAATCFLIAVPLLLAFWGMTSLRVDADHVARSGFLHLGTDRRPLGEVVAVEVVPGKGQDILHLTFTDGEVWEIDHGGFLYPPGGAAAVAVQIERAMARQPAGPPSRGGGADSAVKPSTTNSAPPPRGGGPAGDAAAAHRQPLTPAPSDKP